MDNHIFFYVNSKHELMFYVAKISTLMTNMEMSNKNKIE